ncbi:MAG: ABC transporter permease [Chlorobiaceae bacterium]|jgi:lipoprotein-releasing system permease protein|nr:ABC transporter permease [Chlorobiaceae bacterium]NTW63389.1 ABC transporter permease [Chlorobiaceae bacterium]
MRAAFFIARRFAFRQRSGSKPTFIVLASVIGIAVGTAALILTLSIVKGFAVSIEKKLITFSAHLQVRQSDDHDFAETRSDLSAIRSYPEVESASPFYEKNLILKSKSATENADVPLVKPVVLKGISDIEMQRFLANRLLAGTRQERENPDALGLYIGKSLAENLALKTGDKVLLIGMQKGTIENVGTDQAGILDLLASLDLESGIIQGIYDTGLQQGFDDFVLLGDLEKVQDRFGPGMISGYEVRVRNIGLVDKTSETLASRLGFPFFSSTVFQRYANLFEWLKLQKNITPLLIITITVVAVFNILSTILVLIIEKTREIGMLGALGVEPGTISMIFLGQAFFIAFIGIAAGNILALSLSLFEMRFHLITLPEKSYFIKYVPLLIEPMDYLVVSVSVMLLTLLFAIIPARIAASLKPGTALGS